MTGVRLHGRLAGRLQHVQQIAQFGQGSPTCLADRRERRDDSVRRFNEVFRGAGLHDHGGDMVGHHVVQFPRDARAFGCGRGGSRQPPPYGLLNPPLAHEGTKHPARRKEQVEDQEVGQPVG